MVGIEDETFGQIVAAVIVVNEDIASVSTEEIREYLKSRLAHYKVPRIVHAVSSIPKNQLGKVLV